jgi:uncharacterized delta-60 repeat protein
MERDATPERTRGWWSIAALSLWACGGAPPRAQEVAPSDAANLDSAPATLAAGGDAGDSAEGSAPAFQVLLDSTFGMGGYIDGSLTVWTPAGVAVDEQKRILVAGPEQDPGLPVVEVVRRFTEDGVLDPSFGTSGRVTLDVGPIQWEQAVRSWPGGNVGVLGAASVGGGEGAFAERLGADGSSDPNFVPLLTGTAGSFSAGLWLDDGSGWVLATDSVVRFHAGGALDGAYDARGGASSAVAGVASADGRLWAAGGRRVSRLLPSGMPDPSFGLGGFVDLSWLNPGAESPTIERLELDVSDKVVVVAAHAAQGSYAIDLARLGASGAVDTTFGSGGFVSLSATGGPAGTARLSDGRLVVWTSYGELLATDPDGSPLGSADLQVNGTVLSATLDAQQRLVVAGMRTSDPLRLRWFVRRYVIR